MQRAFRIGSVFVPSLAAVLLAIRAGEGDVHVAGLVLAGLWIAMALALWARYRQARRTDDGQPLAQLDVLSATGRATAWSALAAILLAFGTGWASLSVLGVLGVGLTCTAVAWIAIMAGGNAPWRSATIERTIRPEVGVEGELLTERLRLDGVRVPAAMRLFATGRATRHGTVSRYAIGAEAGGGAVELECLLGYAMRGEHHAPPMTMWLGDVLGLTRTAPFEPATTETRFTVLPRPIELAEVHELLGDGGVAPTSRDAVKLPTEGSFRIREYQPGDDTRRIHWVRSLQAGQLVVRLPDEVPPADPVVRLILDNHLAHTDMFSCRAPGELLDAMVRVWLGIGAELIRRGARVTLVTGMPRGDGGELHPAQRSMHARATHEARRFAARVAWQPTVRLDMLLDDRGAPAPTRQIVVSCRPRAPGERASAAQIAWVVVPHNDWTSPEAWPTPPSAVRLPFPVGSAENRYARRRAHDKLLAEQWQDRTLFRDLCAFDWKSFSGSLVARPTGHAAFANTAVLQVIP